MQELSVHEMDIPKFSTKNPVPQFGFSKTSLVVG